MVKILQVIYGINIGGAETFLYNILSNLEPEEYQMDFLIQDNNITNIKLYELIQKRGGQVYIVPKFYKNCYRYVLEVKRIVRGSYDIVHIHMNALINIIPILLAKHNGQRIVVHSHNSQNNSGGIIGTWTHKFNRGLIKTIDTRNVACGKMAGEWMFGNRPFLVLDNAISTKNYRFSAEQREIIREQFQIKDKIVIGHVGRFVEAKNHEYILHIFSKFVELHSEAVLMLIGDGSLMASIAEKAKVLSIEDKVIFVGNKSDAMPYYSAFDCLLFPSLFEGLPFVLVEAQANGLPIVASDCITCEMDIAGNIKFLSLDAEEKEWIEALERAIQPVDRLFYYEKMKHTKYNIEVMIEKVRDLYNVDFER